MDQQNQQLSKAERRRAKRERKQQERQKQQRQEKTGRLLKRVIWLLVGAGALVGLGFVVSNQKILPPTTSQGHIEQSPQSHILTEPMPLNVQKHMLEHADGSGPPGIIINYNCQQFECESGFIDNLVKIVEEYPQHVYVAPYRNMSAKLVITAEGRQDILDNFDEQRIRGFIQRGRD